MDYLFMKICFICSCSAWVWVEVLTAPRESLEWVTAYYPKILTPKPLMCVICFSGWLSIFFVPFVMNDYFLLTDFNFWAYVIFAPIITMTITKLIIKN